MNQKEIDLKISTIIVQAQTRTLRGESVSLVQKLQAASNSLRFTPNPSLEERIARMESMYGNDIPMVLQRDVLANIIKLRARKIIKDHCE